MEYVREGNLYKRIVQSEEISESETKVFTKNLIEVAGFIHCKGIIHRDIKPENILMTSKDSIFPFKIADFGLACFSKQHETTCAGSPGYMAPEMLRGEAYTLKIDFFSIGVISFILLTGFTPFGANSTRDTIAKNLKCQIPFNSSSIKKLPLQARNFLKKILNPDPEIRPGSVDLLRSDWLRQGKNVDQDNTSTTVKVNFQEVGYSFSNAAENFHY
jgi:serine/threonine protein kinase